ncbi:MAG: type II toxin-antitoxin system HicB family antitoxin [Chromatiales bacterium]|nr:type II toxin-antitoxin system HicB family antitoxin [Chromatiales bacterium]
MKYPVAIHHQDERGFGITVPDLPGCFSAGESVDSAVDSAHDAISCHLEGLMLAGEAIPAARDIRQHIEDARLGDVLCWAVVSVDLSKLSGRARRINITIPERILSQVDAYAAGTGQSRSGLIARAAVEFIGRQKAG